MFVDCLQCYTHKLCIQQNWSITIPWRKKMPDPLPQFLRLRSGYDVRWSYVEHICGSWKMRRYEKWPNHLWRPRNTYAVNVANYNNHDDVIKWKHFPRYWPFVRGIHRSPVNSPHKGQWRGALMFSLICAWINGWVNNREAGDLRRHRAHYDVTVMSMTTWRENDFRIIGPLSVGYLSVSVGFYVFFAVSRELLSKQWSFRVRKMCLTSDRNEKMSQKFSNLIQKCVWHLPDSVCQLSNMFRENTEVVGGLRRYDALMMLLQWCGMWIHRGTCQTYMRNNCRTRWFSASLQCLLCASNGDIAVLH